MVYIEAGLEPEAPEYDPGGFQVVEWIALIMEKSPSQNERRSLDPNGRINHHLQTRRDLLARAWRTENTLLAVLNEAMLKEIRHEGRLSAVVQSINQRLGRLIDQDEGLSDLAAALSEALGRARAFALKQGYAPEQIDTSSIERYRQYRGAAAEQPHE